MIKLGITGGIGSGKSFVARLLEDRGVPVYFTDLAARRLMNGSAAIREALVRLIGAEAYGADGRLNRQAVARFLFSSPRHAADVDGIVHPAVRDDFRQWAAARSEQGVPVVAMECAILYESGFDSLTDVVVAVCAPEQVRMARVMARDGASAEQVRERMAMQWTDEQRSARADFVILNDGRSDLCSEVDALLGHLLTAEKSSR